MKQSRKKKFSPFSGFNSQPNDESHELKADSGATETIARIKRNN